MTPEARVALYFFVQFMSVGMINAFAGIWFGSLGLSAFQIGVIGALPVALLLFLALSVGRIADRARDWRQVIVGGAILSALFPVGLLFSTAFWAVLVFWTGMAVTQRAIVPVTDAAALRLARRRGVEFGPMRALSTLGYLIVILIAGYAMGDGGLWLFLPVFLALGALRAVVALALPRMRAEDHRPRAAPVRLTGKLSRVFLLTVAGFALVNTSHFVLNSFQGYLWAQQGISIGVIGGLIALGALSETAMFTWFRQVARRFSSRALIAAGAGLAMLRWIAMAAEPGVPVLVGLQCLHAVTYAMGFLACTNFIADHTSEDNAAEGQSVLVVMELGFSIAIMLLFGALAGAAGSGAYLVSVVFAGAGLLCVASVLRRPVGMGAA